MRSTTPLRLSHCRALNGACRPPLVGVSIVKRRKSERFTLADSAEACMRYGATVLMADLRKQRERGTGVFR